MATAGEPGATSRAARMAALRDSAMANAYYLRSSFLRHSVTHGLESGRTQPGGREMILEAELYLQRALESAPESLYLWWEYAALNHGLGRVGKVVTAYEHLSELAPSAMVWTRLGGMYELRGEPDRAVQAYRKALALDARNVALSEHVIDVYIEAGMAARKRGDDELALEHFRRAHAELRALDHYESKVRLRAKEGLLCELQDDLAGALEAYEAAAALDSSDPEPPMRAARVHFALGEAAERRGDTGGAKEHFARAAQTVLTVVPGKRRSAEALNFAAYTLAQAGHELETAEQLVRQALERDESNGAYIDTLGWIHFRRGQLDDALAAILRAHELEGDDPVIMDHLGDVYLKLGQPDKARDVWERSLQLDADNLSIERKLQQLR